MNEQRIATFRDWKGKDIEFWEDADGDVGVMLSGDERSIVIARESVPGLIAWLGGIMEHKSTKELIREAIDAVGQVSQPQPSAIVASTIGMTLFVKAFGADTSEVADRLVGLPLFQRATIKEAIAAAKAVGHHTFITLG